MAILVAVWAAATEAQPYAGPPSNLTAYWEEPAFKDHPYKGPNSAAGVLFWSHGLSGQLPQWHTPPPPIIREFAKRGWDAVKVQRNNLHENGWSSSGEPHVADLLSRVRTARANGYRHIIVAGQSYGGAISLEAGGRSDQILGVIAFGPGHGSDACGASAGTSSRDLSANLPSYLADTIGKMRAPRVVLSMADGDECMGHQRPSAGLEAALKGSPARYIHFDDTMPIRGHFAALTNQFSVWYRDCLIEFLAPDREPAVSRTVCPPPTNAKYLLPVNLALKPATAKPTALSDLVGLWSGAYASPDTYVDRDRNVCLAIREISEGNIGATAYFGAGPARAASMTVLPLAAGRVGGGFTHRGQEQYAFTLTPLFADAAIDIAITSRDGKNTFRGRLRPSNCVE